MNSVSLLGRLTKDPEVRNTAQGTAVCSFTIAVNRRFKKDEADFINIVAWNQTATFCGQYFTKGQQVAISGRIQVRPWEDNEGKKHYAFEVVAESVYFADSKRHDKEEEGENVSLDALERGELPF
jgi:single-strand DNA-binding protein